MQITASLVNELRTKTGAGMMDCKKALTEANGDIEKSIEILRKKGSAVATKRADRAANEGIILTKISEDKKIGSILELNCETDFVAKSDDFVKFAQAAIEIALSLKAVSVADLYAKNNELQSNLTDLVGKVGEKIELSRVSIVNSENGLLTDYIHPGSKLAVLVHFSNLPNEKFESFSIIAKDISMQIAAMKPLSVYRDEIAKEIIEKEIEIYKEVAKKEGKPENILEKIALGRLNKFYQENCLSEQAYIKDNTKSISDLIKEFNSQHSTNVKITSFLRYHLGDEKKN